MADPTALEDEASSWQYSPASTPVQTAIQGASDPNVSPDQTEQNEVAAITYDPQQAKAQAQQQAIQDRQQQAAYRVSGQDLSRRGIGYYTDLGTGAPTPVTDESGAPLTNFSQRSGVGYDSQGNPRKLSFDSQTGAPELKDPYEGAPKTTDKAGNIYTSPSGLPWRFEGVNPDIQQKNQEAQQAKLDAAAVPLLTGPVAMAKSKFTQMQQAVDQSEKSTAATLQSLGVSTTDQKGQPIDLTNTDPTQLRQMVQGSFDSELKSSEANDKSLFGSGLTQSAEALRQDIGNRQKQASDALDNHIGVVSAMQQAGNDYDQARAPLAAINVARINRLNDQREAAGMQPIPVPDELLRVSKIAPPPIPGMDHLGQPTQSSAPVSQAPTTAPTATPTATPQEPEGAVGSFLRPLVSGLAPALGTAAGGAVGALAGDIGGGVVPNPVSIAAAIAGDVAGGAAGGLLAQKAQNALMGGEWTEQNQAHMAANAKNHPIASALGSALPMLVSMLGGGGAAKTAGEGLEKAAQGLLSRTVSATEGNPGLLTKAMSYLAEKSSAVPSLLTTGARVTGAQAAQEDVNQNRGFSDVLPAAIKGAVTFGPTAFVPAATTLMASSPTIGKLLIGGAKGLGMASVMEVSNALYDHFVEGKPIDAKEMATRFGTSGPAFAIQEALMGVLHGTAPERGETEPPEAKGPTEPVAPTTPEAPEKAVTGRVVEPGEQPNQASEQPVAKPETPVPAAPEQSGVAHPAEEPAKAAPEVAPTTQPSPPAETPIAATERTPAEEAPAAVSTEIPGVPKTPEGNQAHSDATSELESHASTLGKLDHPVEFASGTTEGNKSGFEYNPSDQRIHLDADKVAEATKGMDDGKRKEWIKRAVGEEVIHAATDKWAQEGDNGKKLESLADDNEAMDHAAKTYGEGWPTDKRSQASEYVRMLIQGKEKLTESSYKVLRDFLNWIGERLGKLTGSEKEVVDGIRERMGEFAKDHASKQEAIPGFEKESPATAKLREAHQDVLSELNAARDALKSGFGDEDTEEEIRSLEAREKALRSKLTPKGEPESKAEAPKEIPGLESKPESQVGSKVRVGNSPQLHTITEELAPQKGDLPDEKYFKVTNDKTGREQTVESKDITPVKERTAEEKQSAKAASEKTTQTLDKKLRDAGLNPKDFPDAESKRYALGRKKALGAATPDDKSKESATPEGVIQKSSTPTWTDAVRETIWEQEALRKERSQNEKLPFSQENFENWMTYHKYDPEEISGELEELEKGHETGTYKEWKKSVEDRISERGLLGAANPSDGTPSKESTPEVEEKPLSESPQPSPSHQGAFVDDSLRAEDGKTAGERLIRQADEAGMSYSLETLKGMIREDPKTMETMRNRIKAAGKEPLGAASPTESLKDKIERYTPGLDLVKNSVKGIKSLLLPGSIDAEHLNAAETVGARLGSKNRLGEQAAHDLAPESLAFEKMGIGNEKLKTEENPGMRFMSAASKGRQMGETLDAIKNKLDGYWGKLADLMEKAGVPLQKFRESYFPGMWTRDSRIAMDTAFKEARARGEVPEDFDINNAPKELKDTIRARVEQLLKEPTPAGDPKSDIAQYFSKKPLEGSASFKKSKVFDDVGTGAEFGLKPVDMNPIKVAQAKMEEMYRFIMAHQVFGDFEKQGNLINVGNDGKPMKASDASRFNRDEWDKIDDKYGTIWRKGENGELIKAGERWAKKPQARILNNYLSSSLYNSPFFGQAYKAWMGAANALNQSQLGVGSMFHAGFTAMESQVSAAANVIKDAFGVLRGNRSVGDLVKTLAKLPIAVPENLMTGDKVMNAWRDPNGTQDPKVRQIARAVELAGGSFKMEKGLQTDQTHKMVRDWYGDNKLRAAARSPIAAVEMMAKPIMDWLVPRQKAGVFAHMAGRIIDQNPGKSMEDLTPEFRQVWNRVDARLGQVGYSRLFANNTAKNVIQALVRAPGWSGGTIAELVGGFKDAAGFMKEWAQTGKMPKDIPDRTAYTIGLLLTGAVLNGAATYAMTGQKPTGTDFMAFRTGKKDEQGNDERFMLPSYLKDLWAYSQHPGQTLVNKAHPLVSMVGSLAQNKDYYGKEIRNPDSNPAAQAGQAAGYVVKQFEPFWIRGEQKEAERRSSTLEKALPLFGVTPAPKEMNMSPAQRMAAQINSQRIPNLPSTDQQMERRQNRSEASIALRQGDSSVLQKELQQGKLQPRDVRAITQKATTDPLVYQVKSLPLEQAERVYAVANPTEKAKLLPVMSQKRSREQTGKPFRFQ